MSTVAIVWLIVALVCTAAVLAVLVALIRHVMVLGRALGRFQREVGPIAQEIAEAGGRAGDRSRRMSQRPLGSERGRAVR